MNFAIHFQGKLLNFAIHFKGKLFYFAIHFQGKLLYIDRPDSHPLIMDPSWFSKLLSTVAEYQQNVGLFAAISETSSVVLLTDIEKKSQEVKLGEVNMMYIQTSQNGTIQAYTCSLKS